MKLRVIVIDDEPLARERLRALLKKDAQVEIVGEMGDGESAAAAIRQKKPDAIFLDIHMPRMDGFEVLESLEPANIPWTIFLTAYDQHAVRAFETGALDYLLKPVAKERLAVALKKVRERLLAGAPVPALQEWLAARENSKRLVIQNGSRVDFVPVGTVAWIESAGNYVIVHANGVNHILRKTLNELEQHLPGEQFLRISRSAIVNLGHLATLNSTLGRTTAVLNNGHQLPVTRSRQEIEGRLRLA